MKKRTLTAWAIALLALCTARAEQHTEETAAAAPTGNWYVEIGAGTQLLFGQDAAQLAFGQRLTPLLSLTGGRWFNPWWGVRLQASGYALNGFSAAQGLYLGDPTGTSALYGTDDPVRGFVSVRPDGSYRYYLRHLSLHADWHVSLANLVWGHDPARPWDVVPAVGIGYFQTFPYKGTTGVATLSTHFSVAGKWKLPHNLDLNLELSTALLPDRFDGRITTRNYEPTLGLALGITYHFKGRADAPAAPVRPVRGKPEAVPTQDDYMELVRQAVREEVRGNLPAPPPADTVTIIREIEKPQAAPPAPRTVRIASLQFDSEQARPRAGQDMQIANIVAFAHDNPQARILIEGYADDRTGSPNYNLSLSRKRAQSVYDLLVKAGISPDRLEAVGHGSAVQVYEQSDWNRVVTVSAMW